MLKAPGLRRRVLSGPWNSVSVDSIRATIHNSASQRNGSKTRERGRGGDGKHGRDIKRKINDLSKIPAESREPSLIEQLFPEETKRYEEAKRRASREIPRLPLEDVKPEHKPQYEKFERDSRSLAARDAYDQMKRHMEASGDQTSVLVLRNASPNLVEEDFRRLIPQGKHMEGWTLEQGDILKVIPGRDLATLEQLTYYYLIFSSQLSAFAYQGRATRIFQLAAAHTPSSIMSPIPAPSGYMVDGMDVGAAIESFSLVPASQTLELRQLRPPLSPMMESIVRNQGYASIVHREDKMPFEVRLVLDGPQLQISTIRWILHASGKDRALPWSGGDEIIPCITKWESLSNASPLDPDSGRAWHVSKERTELEQAERDAVKLQGALRVGTGTGTDGQRRRMLLSVYIVGFHTEHAAQTFIRSWHRRPMTWKGVETGKDEDEDDLPPIANVEMLW